MCEFNSSTPRTTYTYPGQVNRGCKKIRKHNLAKDKLHRVLGRSERSSSQYYVATYRLCAPGRDGRLVEGTLIGWSTTANTAGRFVTCTESRQARYGL